MKICPNCHRKNYNGAKFCRFCGNKFPKHQPSASVAPQPRHSSVNQSQSSAPQPQPTQPKPKFQVCPNCGAKNKLRAKFCYKCGYNFSGNVQPTRTQRTPKRKPRYSSQKEQATNEYPGMAHFGDSVGNYFVWLKDTLADPLGEYHAKSYYGIISFVITMLVLTTSNVLVTGDWLLDTFNGLMPAGGKLAELYIDSSFNAPYAYITGFVNVFIYVLGVFIAERYLSKRKIPFMKSLNNFAGLTNLTVPASFIVAVLDILIDGQRTLIAQLLQNRLSFIIPTIFLIGVVISIMSAHKDMRTKVSPAYVSVITVILIIFVQVFATLAIGNI